MVVSLYFGVEKWRSFEEPCSILLFFLVGMWLNGHPRSPSASQPGSFLERSTKRLGVSEALRPANPDFRIQTKNNLLGGTGKRVLGVSCTHSGGWPLYHLPEIQLAPIKGMTVVDPIWRMTILKGKKWW